jgi:hypothetical protein
LPVPLNLHQTAQHTAQHIKQRIPVRAVDQAGKQLVEVVKILVAEMNADRDNPGSLQGAQVRQREVPVGYGAGGETIGIFSQIGLQIYNFIL